MMDIDELDLYWLAGILEGEGSFTRGVPSMPTKPILTMKTCDEDVAQRVASLLKVTYIFQYPEHFKENGWKPYYSIRVAGERAVGFMNLLRPLMGHRRQAQIDTALACYTGDNRYVLQGERLEEFKRRLQNGEHVITLAKEFGVSKSYAYLIRKQCS